jgi:hypothetical protein
MNAKIKFSLLYIDTPWITFPAVWERERGKNVARNLSYLESVRCQMEFSAFKDKFLLVCESRDVESSDSNERRWTNDIWIERQRKLFSWSLNTSKQIRPKGAWQMLINMTFIYTFNEEGRFIAMAVSCVHCTQLIPSGFAVRNITAVVMKTCRSTCCWKAISCSRLRESLIVAGRKFCLAGDLRVNILTNKKPKNGSRQAAWSWNGKPIVNVNYREFSLM